MENNKFTQLKTEITNNCISWAHDNLSTDENKFEFREHQLEAIVNIIYNILTYDNYNNIMDNYTGHYPHRHQCIEAPTGSGKSIMLIVSASVLAKYYNKDSYILCSDLSLFKQYEDFVKKMKLDIAYLKGQTGNYICELQDCEFRDAPCRIKKISYAELTNDLVATSLGFPCAKTCEYILARKKARNAKVIITTYQNYLYSVATPEGQRNKASKNKHEILFCDECHNIPGIVQGKFTPTISYDLLDHIETLFDFTIAHKNEKFSFGSHNLQVTFANFAGSEPYPVGKMSVKKIPEALKYYKNIIDELIDFNIDKKNKNTYNLFFDKVKEFEKEIKYFSFLGSMLQDYIKTKVNSEKTPDYKKWRKYYSETNYWANFSCYLHDFMTAIDETDPSYIVRKEIEYADKNKKGCNLQCAREDVIIQKHIFETCRHIVMTSATIGSKYSICENFGTKNIAFYKIPSTFLFENCPIYISTQNKLNFANKAKSLPKILVQIEKILEKYTCHGVIQTGNYEIMNYIINNINAKYKKRLLYYTNTAEKREILEEFKNTENSVLIGPTLYEGIDLPNELCRFVIIAKVPYPCLGDKLIQKKLELFPNWYNSQTSNYIIQGIGRGVRNKTDWAHTFILDACFLHLYNMTKYQYDSNIKNRIEYI